LGNFAPQRVKKTLFFFSLSINALRNQKVVEKDFACDLLRFCHNVVIQNRERLSLPTEKIMNEIRKEISILRETLEDCVLTIAEKVAIRNQIGELQDKLARLSHED